MLGTIWLVGRLFSPASMTSSSLPSLGSTQVEAKKEASEKKSGEKLFGSIWFSGPSAKDRFGRDLNTRAKIDLETQAMRVLFEKGDLALVKSKLDELLKNSPNVPEYVAMLGDYYLALDKYEQAEGAVRRLLEIDPKNTFARETLARALAVSGRLEEAREELYKVLSANPHQESALQKLIVFSGMEGSEEQGIAEVKDFIVSNPKIGAGYSVLAEKYLERGDIAKAYEWAKAGAEADQTHAGNHRLLAVHYAVQGDMAGYLRESRSWAQFESDPEYRAAADLNLIQALQKNGHQEEAYDVALRVETDDVDLKAKAEEIISKYRPRRSR